MYNKRCNFYDDDGHRRRLANGGRGCPNEEAGTCRYIHPDNPKWSSLPPSAPPPDHLLIHETSDRRGRDRHDDGYRRGRTPPRHHSSGHRRSRSPDRDRRSSRTMDRPDVDHSSRSNYKDEWHRSRVDTKPTTTTQHPPAPPPAPPTAMPPAMPPPALPATLESLLPPPSNGKKPDIDPSKAVEDKRKMWTERLKRISESAQAHADFKAISLELEDWRSLTSSWRYVNLSEEDKAQLHSQLTNLEAKCEEKKRLRDEAAARLAETEVWPIEGTQETEASLKRLLTYAAELRDTVMEMNKLLNDMIARRNIRPQEPNPNGMAMDVDPRPSKRSWGVSVDTRRDDQAVAVAELEHLQNKLTGFEQNLSDFENSVTQHDRELEEEVDSRLNDRIGEIRGADVKPVVLHAQTLAGIEQNLNMTGDQVGELAEEVGQLILQSSAQKAELHWLKQENDLLKSQYILVEQKMKDFSDRQEKHMKEMAALTAAFAAHLARPKSPPASPRLAPEVIRQSLGELISESVQARVVPLMDDLRKTVEEHLREQTEGMYEGLLKRLSEVGLGAPEAAGGNQVSPAV